MTEYPSAQHAVCAFDGLDAAMTEPISRYGKPRSVRGLRPPGGASSRNPPSAEGDEPMLYTTSHTAPIFGLRREIDRLFEDAFSGRSDRAAWSPVVNVQETGNELAFEFELPGLKADQVEITCDN